MWERDRHRPPGSKVAIASKALPNPTQFLNGQAAVDASAPLADTPRGGAEFSFRGESTGATATGVAGAPTPLGVMVGTLGQRAAPAQQSPFAGMGPLLEQTDEQVFKTVDGLVLRQDLIALNHLAQDTHWTYVKLGYPWSTLTKEPNRDRYTQSLPYGSAGVTIQAVPNKAWDQVNKTTESLLVDFPQMECEPGDDSDQAEHACDIGDRFLTQQASEQGTNDAVLFWDRIQRSMTCASSYIECWTDPTGGGYVPLQIPAHPQAQSPMQPLIGPDGMPTVSPVLRYVTGPVNPDGTFGDGAQFTDDPTQAAPQWQPKLMASKWQREHIRVCPETATVDTAEKVIVLGYCTIGEGKRRWSSVAQMDPDALSKLCDWTPQRYYVLLPLFQRARWKLTDGRDKNKQGSSDERIFFYYHIFAKASPDHKRGADVVVTGASIGNAGAGFVIDRNLLAMDVELPVPNMEAGQPPKKETRCMEIPVVQITPRGDPDEQDPTGRAYIEMSAGAIENNAHLAMSFSEALDKNLHLEGYAPSTSPVNGQQRDNARATGDIIPLVRPEDKPSWGQLIPLDGSFFNMYKLAAEEINSIGSTVRAAQGQDQAEEKSGRAIQLATANNNVSLGGMNTAVNGSYTRWCRIKLEMAMRDFTTEQTISYVGEDGIYKTEAFKATDFALIGKVTVKAGTGGLITPEAKAQDAIQLVNARILDQNDAADALRPAFSRRLGLPPSPHEQRIERQITAWEKGPPSAEWMRQYQQYAAQKQAFDAATQQFQAAQTQAQAAGVQLNTPAPQAPAAPWSPFMPLPTDDEPLIAQFRQRRLAKLIDSAKFGAQPPEWQQVAIDEYTRMRNAVAASQAPPALPKGVSIQAKAGDAATIAAEEKAATSTSQPQPAAPSPSLPAAPALAS